MNGVENLDYNEKEDKLFRRDGLKLGFSGYLKDKKSIYFKNLEIGKTVKYNKEFRRLSKISKSNIETKIG